MLHESCQQPATWRGNDSSRAPDLIGINVSRVQLAPGERFPASVRETLRETGVPARCLPLEVTASEVMRDPMAPPRSPARETPFDIVKTDRSFVSEHENDTPTSSQYCAQPLL